MPKMKDSGVEWLGEIPESWIILKIKYSSAFINGFAFDSNQFSIDGKYPVIRIGDFQNNQINYNIANKIDDNSNLESYQILENDILIAMSGATVGKIAYVSKVDSPSYINQRVGIIRNDNPNFSSKYVYYSLLSPEFIKYIYYTSFGSAQPNVSSGTIMDYYITFSSLEQQEETSFFLDLKTSRIKSLIDNLNNQIDKLKEYKKALITKCVIKGLDPNVPLKDSGIDWIGKIPENWSVLKLKQLADPTKQDSFIDGDWIESNYILSDGIRYLTTGNIGDGEYKEQGDGYISETTFTELDCKYAYPGDLVISRLNAPFGRSCILPNTFDKFVIAVDNVILRPRADVSKQYICYVTQCAGYQFSVSERASGSTMQRISRVKLGNIFLPVPPIGEQKFITGYLDKKCSEIDSLISSKQQQIDKLNEYQKSLIYEYVTGKKEVI